MDIDNIKDRFITKEVNSAGVYLLKFYVKNVETLVVIDDFVPVINGKTAFAGSKSGSFWAILLEKGFAKLLGSYAAILNGLPAKAF